jgi:predicted kinase
MCGLPCAGKTTLAKQLEIEHHALRLTPDEWQIALFGPEPDDERHTQIEAVMWTVAARVLQLGQDVILDFGFWSHEERDDFRTRAAALGADCRVHYLSATLPTLQARAEQRNAQLPDHTFEVGPEELADWFCRFEAPADDELG